MIVETFDAAVNFVKVMTLQCTCPDVQTTLSRAEHLGLISESDSTRAWAVPGQQW